MPCASIAERVAMPYATCAVYEIYASAAMMTHARHVALLYVPRLFCRDTQQRYNDAARA